jgi:16S rRNA (guanine527-N7)-methyltransferase
MDLALPSMAMDQLTNYLDLMVKWNRVYNLTAIRDPAKLVSHHVLDSLSVLHHLPEGSLVDVGSGAGLPGIPIAISCPGRTVALIDSNHKKGAFLQQAVAELGLASVKVVVKRVEAYRPAGLFRVVISRAFSNLADFVDAAGHLCAADGIVMAMKGARPDEEMARLPTAWMVDESLPLTIPQLDASRHLVLMRPASSSPLN